MCKEPTQERNQQTHEYTTSKERFLRRNTEEENQLENLTQTISNIVGVLMGLVGAVGAGFFVYGAYQYLTAGGAPHQMERGKSAMMTAIAGIVLALVAYGIVELVMNAVVDPVIDVDDVLPEPATPLPPTATPTP